MTTLAWSGRVGAISTRAPDVCVMRKPSSFSASSEPPAFDEVVDRPVRREPEREAEVAELQVEVDEHDLLAAHRERDREVGRDERLAGSALRAEHADERRGRLAGGGRRAARLPGDRLLQREAHTSSGSCGRTTTSSAPASKTG